MISIIIPTYNGSAFIKTAIESAINQNVKESEVIIIDDNSNDSTKKIINKYKQHPNIKILFNKKNNGLSYNVNLGVRASKYKYILLLGHDDIVDPNHCTILLSEISTHEDNALVFCNSYIVDKKNKIIGLTLNEVTPRIKSKLPLLSFFRSNFIQSCGLIFSKKHYIAAGGWQLSYKNFGEYDLWIRMASSGKIIYSDKIRSYYRTHQKNISKIIQEKQNEEYADYISKCRMSALRKIFRIIK